MVELSKCIPTTPKSSRIFLCLPSGQVGVIGDLFGGAGGTLSHHAITI